jgi:hypothetical protein
MFNTLPGTNHSVEMYKQFLEDEGIDFVKVIEESTAEGSYRRLIAIPETH